MFSPDGQYRVQGWAVSVFVHSLALTVTLGLMAQVKPVVPKEAFQWDVSLVEPVVQREIRQVIETSQPIQETAPVQTRTEAVTPIREQQPVEVQQTTQAIVESVAPIAHHEAVNTASATPAAPC